jgi:transposase
MKAMQNLRLVKYSKTTDCWCAFSWSVCDKNATLLGVSRATIPKGMMAYTDHGETSSAERNSGRQPKQSEGDRCTLQRIVSKIHRTAAANVTAELNIHMEDRYHKNSPTRPHKFNTH